MNELSTVLEIVGLLAIIVVPLFAPSKHKKQEEVTVLSDIAVNEGGFLEYYHLPDENDHHHAH